MRGFFKVVIVLLVLSNTVYGQKWLWSKSQNINSTNYTKGNIRLGNSGHLVTFLSDNTSTQLTLTDAEGDVIWNQSVDNLSVKDVIIDSFDNIYFAGSFSGEIEISGMKLRSNGNSDAIIGMLNNKGTLTKAKTFGGAAEEAVNSITMNGLDLYATGHFRDAQTINSVTLHGDGKNYNTFILKLNTDLTILNGTETASEGSTGIKIAVDKYNSVYVLGNANYSVGIGSNAVGIEGTGQYMAKLNKNFKVMWLQAIIDDGSYGYYKPYIFFDFDANFVLGRVSGDNDNILAVEKFDPLGSRIWSTNVKINLDNLMDMDNNCNIYVAGGYTGSDGLYELSIVKVNPTGVSSTLVYNNEIIHRVKGLAVMRNKDLYVTYSCGGSPALVPFSECEPDVVFMARYGSGAKEINIKESVVKTFKIRPNDGSGVVVINCNSGKKQNCVLLVKNTLGEIVYIDPMKDVEGNYSKVIDLSTQPKGIYFIEMRSGEDSSVEKIAFQ
jgi:hypothetical protein